MELDNGIMNFNDDDQRFGEVPATSSVENAPMVHLRVTELLAASKEKLDRLSQADDDELMHFERAEVAPLTAKVEALERLSTQLGNACMHQGIDDFLRKQ